MSVATASRQAAFCTTFVDELVRGGVTDAVVCPGSRSTPMALALAASPIEIHVRLDERSACFVAVGLARATRRPVAVLVTSGTAAAELHAGVIEAHLDRVPLIVITADRPPEVRSTGAAQTIDQRGLFGTHVRASFDPGPAHAIDRALWRPLASRLVAEAARGQVAGPVSINLGFVEPLVADPDLVDEGRPEGRPWFSMSKVESAVDLPSTLDPSRRGVLMIGQGAGDPIAIVAAARSLGWPVLADPRSRARFEDEVVVAAADVILREPAIARQLTPEVIVIAGAPPASKVLATWVSEMASSGVDIIVVGADGLERHPSMTAAEVIVGDPDCLWTAIADRGFETARGDWLGNWATAEQSADRVIEAICGSGTWSEPSVLRAVASISRDDVEIVVSSSMPIRDLEWFGGRRNSPQVVHANRGANGIDGVVSTAIGVAAGSSGPVVAVVGDLAFLHDSTALVEGLDPDAGSLTVVVLDNGGGGIFSFLPQRSSLEESTFRSLFATPRSAKPDEVARAFGIPSERVDDRKAFDDALAAGFGEPGMRVICCTMPDHDQNVAIHASIVSGVAEALRT